MSGPLTGPASNTYQRFFIPSVCLLITFLGYTSQWLFNAAENLEPGPMTKRETTIFNILLACAWSTYYKACTVAPGRYTFPPPPSEDQQQQNPDPSSTKPPSSSAAAVPNLPARWCTKCAAPKPLRAHHCRLCNQCIPKMDHHCPWTGQCVSLQTFPHFLRFLLYTNLALTYLHVALLYPRLQALFVSTTPSYLGPRTTAMVHLLLLALVGFFTSILLLVMLVTSVRGWVLNQTMIEGWEIERHDAVLARARRTGGYWDADDNTGARVRIDRVEFPYDLSFFANMAQAMGTRNVLAWLDPFVGCHPVVAPHPALQQTQIQKNNTKKSKSVDMTGWTYEENGFNDREGMWPPPDPDKLRRGVPRRNNPQWREQERAEISALEGRWRDPDGEVRAFRERQEADLRRRGLSGAFAEVEDEDEMEEGYEYVDGDSGSGGGYDVDGEDEEEDGEDVPLVGDGSKTAYEQGIDGEPGWTNAEGDRLRDYGVDEEAEEDDEDVPLGELLRRRKAFRGVAA